MAYMFDCSPAGTPTRRISPSRRPWKRTCFQSSRYTVSARVSDTSTSTALTPWERMVAKAAAQHAHAQHRDQHNVQSDVHQARDDEEVQRAAGVAHGPQDAGTHVIQKGRDGAQHVNAQIDEGKVHDVGRGAHGAQRQARPPRRLL